MWIRMIVATLLSFGAGATALAQGALNFDDIPGVDSDPVVAIDLSPMMIGFVRNAFRELDPATADILQGLRSIKLRVYNDADNSRQFNSFIQRVSKQLEDEGWSQVAFVQDEGSTVRVHMQMTEQQVAGMTVMLYDGTEAVFINIDGTISAADLGKVMAAVGAQGVVPNLATLGIPPVGAPPRRAPGEE